MTGIDRLKYAVKLVVAHVLYYAGVLHLWQRLFMRRKAVVLMYHRVLTAEERRRTCSHPALVVDRETFARQMRLLKRRFEVLSVRQFADRLERGVPFADSSCVITFDDGWRDNFTNALPILRQHGLPAVVFLPINYIGGRRLFWQEALAHLLLRAVGEVREHPERRTDLQRVLGPAGLDAVLDVPDVDPRTAVLQAVSQQKRMTRSAMEDLLARLASELGVRAEDIGDADAFIDWEQVATMSRQGIAFGGHGLEHLLLTYASPEEVEAEIHGSRRAIDGLGETVPTFSYPNGYCNDDIVGRVRAAGYRLAFSTRRGFVRSGDDRFLVRRINVHESVTRTVPLFMARVVGLF